MKDKLLWNKKAANTTEEKRVIWLRDLLPDYIPEARIATYSYPSEWFRPRSSVRTSLRECGEQFLNVLKLNRQAADVRRLIKSVNPMLNAEVGNKATNPLHWTQYGRLSRETGSRSRKSSSQQD